jgi:ankyrin repeat protein
MNIDIVTLLLDRGATINIVNGGYTPLGLASENLYSDIVSLLLERGADVNLPNGEGTTPLLHVCGSFHMINGRYLRESDALEVVNLLLRYGGDVNVRNIHGYTPLISAVRMGAGRVVEALLNAGARPNVRDENGEYPIHRATLRNMYWCTKLLVEQT